MDRTRRGPSHHCTSGDLPERPHAVTPPQDRPSRVLVVDDDQPIRDLIAMVLSDKGYEAVVAPNGAVALDLVRQTPPRLILLDLMMPVMDGRAFLEACRAETPCLDVPVVVMSAAYGAPTIRELRAEAFLAKPFDLGDVLNVVERFG
jgi:two-component system, chemotaxis family, chemotaxis protein CheY